MAIKRLRDAGSDIVLDIVGGGPDRQRILSLIAKSDLQNAVFLHGELPEEELGQIYGQSKAFVLPSIQGESFGIVLLEAAAHGVPVIASDLPGVRELVKLLGGALVPPKDSDALARTLETVMYNTTPQAPRAIWAERFLWQNVARTYLKCYGKITGLESGVELPALQPMKEIEHMELVQ